MALSLSPSPRKWIGITRHRVQRRPSTHGRRVAHDRLRAHSPPRKAGRSSSMPQWEKRQVGRTKLQVTTLGLGTATMGGSRIPVTRAEGEAMVTAAWDAGVRYVDTATFYGAGAADNLVGS